MNAQPVIERAPTVQHTFSREHSGHGPGDSETVVCACGWRGLPVGNWNDWQETTLQEQQRAHLRQAKGL